MPAATWLERMMDRFTVSTTLHGIPVAIFFPNSAEERTALYAKVDQALVVLKTSAPVRFAAVRSDLPGGVLVRGRPDACAHYDPGRGLCEIYVDWLKDPQVTPEEVASTLVHEAQHARLFRLGFSYAPEFQARIERLCYRAERTFAKRLPDATGLVSAADTSMRHGLEAYTREARKQSERAGLVTLAERNFIVRPLVWAYDLREWLRNRRTTKAAEQADAPEGRRPRTDGGAVRR
jgi:hypothetical protein